MAANPNNFDDFMDVGENDDEAVDVIIHPQIINRRLSIESESESIRSLQNQNSIANVNRLVPFTRFGTDSLEMQFRRDVVSGLNECLTHQARGLCIFGLAEKLNHSDHYDIGGTYYQQNCNFKSELWFYCTTSLCANTNYILNIFVCHRAMGLFAMGISDTNVIAKTKTCAGNPLSYLSLPNTLSWKTFKSCEIDASHHIKTYCFSKDDLKLLNGKALCIPIEINMNPSCIIDKNVIWKIKRNHDLIFKRDDNTDFTIESTSGKKYKVHKILLAAHSSVLRDIMKKSCNDPLIVNIDDNSMEQFLEYMYTGTVSDIQEHNCCQLIEMADKFKLVNLFTDAQIAIAQLISIKNAVNLAILSEKYNLNRIQKKVFEFIRNNHEVLETEAWKNLDDVVLAKKMFKGVYYADRT